MSDTKTAGEMPEDIPSDIRAELDKKIRPFHNRISFRTGAIELWQILKTKHIAVELPSGGIALVSLNATPKVIGAINSMIDIAAKTVDVNEISDIRVLKEKDFDEQVNKILSEEIHVVSNNQNEPQICGIESSSSKIAAYGWNWITAIREGCAEMSSYYEKALGDLKNEIQAYNEVIEDKRNYTRDIDIIINGEKGSAKQASLCDIASQLPDVLSSLREEVKEYRGKLEQYRFHPQLNIEIGLFLERHDRKYTPKDKEEGQ